MSRSRVVGEWLEDLEKFSRFLLLRPLRGYQLEPAMAAVESIRSGRGRTFVVMMARQAGKNELSAQLEAFLLNRYQRRGGQVVKASPTFKPQTINSMMRLEEHLDNPLNRGNVRVRHGYQITLGRARVLFFSAHAQANAVGATADVLLEGDEAQDIAPGKWYKDFVPMGASTNATTVLFGTAWLRVGLLAETKEALREVERKDGVRRVFSYDAERVGAEVPAYAAYVKQQVARLGRQHPLIKTQYFLEEIDGTGGLFGAERQEKMRGDHRRRRNPEPGKVYALLLDIGGQDEEPGPAELRLTLRNPKRDATALTVVEVARQGLKLPVYRVVDRRLWLGEPHSSLYQQILALAEQWHAARIVVDATGVGAGLYGFLQDRLQERVMGVTYSSKVKSEIGWAFVAAIETGRYKEYVPDEKADTRQFWYEVGACGYEVVPGPGQVLRWSVQESPRYDGLVAAGHDDLLMSASLCTRLDEVMVGSGSAASVVRRDVLEEIDEGEW